MLISEDGFDTWGYKTTSVLNDPNDNSFAAIEYNTKKLDSNVLHFVKMIFSISENIVTTYNNPIFSSPKVNYEDLFNIVEQLFRLKSGGHPNIAAKPFLDSLMEKGRKFTNRELSMERLCKEANTYFRNTIWSLLSRPEQDSSVLDIFCAAYLDKALDEVHFFTLNHDSLISNLLHQNQIAYYDGFSNSDGEIRWWDPDLSQTMIEKHIYMQLHGGIDCFWFDIENGNVTGRDIFLGKYIGKKTLSWDKKIFVVDSRGIKYDPGHPHFLIGTENKLVSYNAGIYSEALCIFEITLKRCSSIIVSGYSFSDEGINSRLIKWLAINRNNKMIIIHPDFNDLWDHSSATFRDNMNKWIREGRLIEVRDNFENIRWRQISKLIKQS